MDNRKLVGFSINAGEYKRIVKYYSDSTFQLGCFTGIYDKCIEAINKKYGVHSRGATEYIAKLDEARDFDDSKLEEYVNHEDSEVRVTVTDYDDRYHHILKDDVDWIVRLTVAEYDDKYHKQFKDDEHWMVRTAVEKYKIYNRPVKRSGIRSLLNKFLNIFK
jgi:hypothetical protein